MLLQLGASVADDLPSGMEEDCGNHGCDDKVGPSAVQPIDQTGGNDDRHIVDRVVAGEQPDSPRLRIAALAKAGQDDRSRAVARPGPEPDAPPPLHPPGNST